MRSRDRMHEPHAAHFVTSTIVAWLPVFTTAARCNLPVQSWLHGREHKGLRIHGRAGNSSGLCTFQAACSFAVT